MDDHGSEGEWERSTERRAGDDDQLLHVTIDRMSEAMDGRIGRLEGRFDQAIDVSLKVLWGIFGLVGFLVVASASVGGWVVLRERDIDDRPTRETVAEMIDERTEERVAEIVDELASVKAESRVTRDLVTEGLANLQVSVEALRTQAVELRRDVDRHERGLQ